MTTSMAPTTADDPSARLETLRARLVMPIPGSAFWGWAGPLLVTALGAFLRFNHLGTPRAIIFDETYYVPDALGILKFGTEHNYTSKQVHGALVRDKLLTQGDPHIFTKGGEFVAHPPFGKTFIAVGEWLFGLTPFGWRFASAVVGTLAILILARTARRMTRSTLLGCVAGLLLSLDGLELVMSRTALLDIFVMFWVLAAFSCLVVDRDEYRARLACELDPAAEPPVQWWRRVRWWRVGAGICLGLAVGSKWNGVWFIPVFGLMALFWDFGARRVAGLRGSDDAAVARDLAGLAGTFTVLPLAAYLVTWSGWFATGIGYDRFWAQQHGVNIPVVSPLISLFQYNKAMLAFNAGLRAYHPYASKPWTWMVLYRPVSYYWHCVPVVHGSCSGHTQEVLAIGTPALWWASIFAVLGCVGWWLARRDWRAGAVVAAVAAGWLPWFIFPDRTQFYFYSVAFVPYLVLGVTLCLGLLIGPLHAPIWRRTLGSGLAGAYTLAVLANFAYLYPILTAQTIPYSSWLSRMWFHTWI